MTTLDVHPTTRGEYVQLDGEVYYRISQAQLMPEFFMSLVGASDHWMFISSHGALTAGRRNPDQSLFLYVPDDQISASRASTGSVSLIRVAGDYDPVWVPFEDLPAPTPTIQRNLYKTPLGNKLVFEEYNETLQLKFRYRWCFSNRFGFVRTCWIENVGSESTSLEWVDGLQNLLPSGVENEFFVRYSNLANAYKKNELVTGSNLGLYYLSSVPTDKAEPSEGLSASVVWQTGLSPAATLLSTEQLSAFRQGGSPQSELDVRGKPGAYLGSYSESLEPGESVKWHTVADLSKDHSGVIQLNDWLQSTDDHQLDLMEDIAAGEEDLLRVIATTDGLQQGDNLNRTNRHLSNTVFNLMRGGVPVSQYQVQAADFVANVKKFNAKAFQRQQTFLTALPETISSDELVRLVTQQDDRDLLRLAQEYLPLAFSRRHGDPTRPWNRFSIEHLDENGEIKLNYQGNWRDIFQNWEAIGLSFPRFLTAMICRFVNATSADGYNPYRLMKEGYEWEEPAPDDPWSNIGYWGDHQIIYLLKLLEWNERFDPGSMAQLLTQTNFVHANIPYRIKPFAEIRQNPSETIEFDKDAAAEIAERVAVLGTDGKLLSNQNGDVHYVSLLEKILTLSLAKLSNFVPDAGIWLNTQRPEWNDANNALVGNGVSMVTTCYLYRWFQFMQRWIDQQPGEAVELSVEVAGFMQQIAATLQESAPLLGKKLTPSERANVVEALSTAGSQYRDQLYENGPSGASQQVSKSDVLKLCTIASQFLESTIANNLRSDGLCHAYNLLNWQENGLEVEYLYEMLEGQVAVLSAGLLEPKQVVAVLDALRESNLYRADQNSYILYPDRQLPRFLDKNSFSIEFVNSNQLLKKLVDQQDETIIKRDVRGDFHFCPRYRNSAELRDGLAELRSDYQDLVSECGDDLIQKFEDLFNHRQFTGRSGTFFGYEGLGSIYWHMVSKLGLAVSENYEWAKRRNAPPEILNRLGEHLEHIRAGIGSEKSPNEYGAFPTDPYSHTPEKAGVKQPGMTGQVKEDVLARFAELGVSVENGKLSFGVDLLDRNELSKTESKFEYFSLDGRSASLVQPAGSLVFTLFQLPIIYQAGSEDRVNVHFQDGNVDSVTGHQLDEPTSSELFSRTGKIKRLDCYFKELNVPRSF